MDDKYDKCMSTQLIDGDGNFNVTGIDRFVKGVKLAERGESYAIVSIMGPQSSGKSTLLNHLFGTNFREMNAVIERSQTTKGIWIAKCAEIDPFTVVMDLEGCDGRERGEDETFEKQSALFALAVSDIVLINMWCNDIGREHAANKPLLKTVFQAMLRLFSPRKTTLIFVIRDKTETSLESLGSLLRTDTQKIWESVPKPPAHKNTPLSDFFNIKVVALSPYLYMVREFKEQVSKLRQQFFNSIGPGGLAGDRRSVVPASGFSISAQRIWKIIKKNKDLDLPALKVMVATVRCDEIADEMCSKFTHNLDWLHLEKASQSGSVPDFGRKLNSILGSCFSEYDAEALYFDEGVRTSKRKHLEDKLLKLIEPAFQSMLGHLCSGALKKFEKAFAKALNAGERFSDAAQRCQKSVVDAFDKDCAGSVVEQANWDVNKARSKLCNGLSEHITSIRDSKLGELTPCHKTKLKEALSRPIEALLEHPNDETWPSIRALLNRETQSAVCTLARDLSCFGLDEKTTNKMLANIKEYGRGVAEKKAKEAAGKVLFLMKDRFVTFLQSDQQSRGWTKKSDIITAADNARSLSLKVLSVVSAIRFDDESDDIYKRLSHALLVPSSQTLITPAQCRSLLKQFDMETAFIVNQATFALEKAKRKKEKWKWLAGVAVSAAMMSLGFSTS